MDSQSTGGLPGADWYPDPAGRHESRYWDGAVWSDNVADAGQASVDPMEAPPAQSVDDLALEPSATPVPEPPTTPVPEPSAAPGPARRRTKMFVILGLVLLLVVALGFGGYYIVKRSLVAKDAAASSIAAARKAMTAADPAVEPGSQELTESQKSESLLDEATALLAQGSLIQPGPYRNAKTKADQARAIAQGITDRVEALDTDAYSASAEDSIAKYFALYEKYPRTQQGKDAIDSAATVLLDSLGSGAAIDDLDSINAFCTDCPGDVPTTVYEAAAKTIKSIASDSLDSQTSMVSSNQSWVKAIRGKGANFTISSTTAADTVELTHVIEVLPSVQGTDAQTAVTLLRDCSTQGERCGQIAGSPVRKSGNSTYFSPGQVNEIEKLSTQMSAKLTQARALLDAL